MQELVLLPGLMCDVEVWRGQISALVDLATCTCLDWGSLDSIASMAELVLRTAPERFALAGHSMGGRVAFEVYRRAPDRVTRIAQLNTAVSSRAAGAAGEEEERKRLALLQVARTAGMRAMAMEWLPPMMHPNRMSDTTLVESIVAMIERKTPDIFEAQIKALLGRPDATAVLQLIRCPALFLSGREDGWSPPSRHAEMSTAVPGSKLAVIPDSGHMSTMEQPAAVARAMRDWLEM